MSNVNGANKKNEYKNILATSLGRKKILVIEDQEENRDFLRKLFQDEFDVILAKSGEEGFEILLQQYMQLEIVILDTDLPGFTGFEFLKKVQAEETLSEVQIIVTAQSGNRSEEEKALSLGAVDFVTKPYNAKVLSGRVRNRIKLKESVDILSVTEYDSLTNLYTIQAFYYYGRKILDANMDTKWDMFVANVKEFRFINSVFGEKKGDEVLTYLGKLYAKYMKNGIGARQGDKFYFLLPDYAIPSFDAVNECISHATNHSPVTSLNIKYGIYKNVEMKQSISILCDRLLMAVDTIKDDYSRNFVVYDKSIKDKWIKNQTIETRFNQAIRNKEFKVFYQPQIDLRTGEIVAAEAFVKWFTEDKRILNPNEFIPIFEKNGLIAILDEYMFERVCKFQQNRLRFHQKVVPVSVNLSKKSIFENEIVETYMDIINQAEVPMDLIPIELVEAAIMEDARIVEKAKSLIEKGFSLHMDNFGSGCSSIASLSLLDFDTLKLNKSLVDQIGNAKGEVILKYTIKIAKEMGMTVVAEGVEKEHQVKFLKENGCDRIQGYYYCAPQDNIIFDRMLV